MCKADTHRGPPQRSRCDRSKTEKKSEREVTEIAVPALAKKEIERRLRRYEKLRRG